MPANTLASAPSTSILTRVGGAPSRWNWSSVIETAVSSVSGRSTSAASDTTLLRPEAPGTACIKTRPDVSETATAMISTFSIPLAATSRRNHSAVLGTGSNARTAPVGPTSRAAHTL